MKKLVAIYAVALLLTVVSCKKKHDEPAPVEPTPTPVVVEPTPALQKCASGPLICQGEVDGCVSFSSIDEIKKAVSHEPKWDSCVQVDGVSIGISGFGPCFECHSKK